MAYYDITPTILNRILTELTDQESYGEADSLVQPIITYAEPLDLTRDEDGLVHLELFINGGHHYATIEVIEERDGTYGYEIFIQPQVIIQLVVRPPFRLDDASEHIYTNGEEVNSIIDDSNNDANHCIKSELAQHYAERFWVQFNKEGM